MAPDIAFLIDNETPWRAELNADALRFVRDAYRELASAEKNAGVNVVELVNDSDVESAVSRMNVALSRHLTRLPGSKEGGNGT